MAPDFRKMAEQHRAQFEAEQASKEEARRVERQAHEAQIAKDIENLERALDASFSQAEEDLAAQRIGMEVSKQFDVLRFSNVLPQVTVKLLSPPRKSDKYRGETPSVFFSMEGEVLRVQVADNSHETRPMRELGKAEVGAHDQLLEKAFEFLLKKHYEMLRDLPGYPRDFQV